MSTKDKDVKTLDKLRQFFRINKGLPGSSKSKEDFSLTIDLERDLSSASPLNIRIKTVKDLIETVQNNKLEENAPAKFWCLLEDLLSKDVSCENRHLVFTFFQALIQGQYERLGMMRAQFYKLIRNHTIKDDIVPRLELFQSLTENGKDILYMEETVGSFLLGWMSEVVAIGRELDFLSVLITCIKYNASYFDEDIIAGIVHKTCILCCQSKEEQVVIHCLQVLDTIVCYASLPSESLPPFVATLCKTVNIKLYCQPSWKIMRNLLGTHLGHVTLHTMTEILLCEASLSDPGLLRGAVFYLSMALWGNKRIVSMVSTPSAVLDAFLAAMRCGHTLVMYEVMLGIQLLVNKQGHCLLDPTWAVVLEVIKGITLHIDKNVSSLWNNQVSHHLHETLNKIESLIDDNKFNGQVEMVFDIIEKCSRSRPESSLQRLILYISRSITPARSRWLEKLDSLMLRFFVQEERLAIRKNVLGILIHCIQSYIHMYEGELVQLAVEHLSDIANEPNLTIRSAATQILVELFISCEASRALQVADVIEKILNRGLSRGERLGTEEEGEDLRLASEGLVRGLTSWMFRSPASPALCAYQLIVSHLEAHYSQPSLLFQAVSIRRAMLDCLLKLRCDARGGMGHVGSNKRFSVFLAIKNDYPIDINSHPLDCEHKLNISRAMAVILSALRIEKDWSVLHSLLQGLPQILKSPALFSPSDVDKIVTSMCDMVTETPANFLEGLTNTPVKFTKSDFHCQVFPVVTSLIPYRSKLDSTSQQMLIKTFESGLAIRSARGCVFALTLCTLEMQDTMVKMLPEVLLNLSKISATVVIALPILEFLSTLTQLPKVFSNFVGDQYMSVFAISLPYTNPFKYNHYTVSLAHHVIAAWFLKCRLPFRRDFVKFIINGLKSNLIIWNEELNLGSRSGELINEDSSNRKRSSSLTEQGSRGKRESSSRAAGPTVAARLDLKPPMDESQVAFHKELAETCSDLMAMYTFSTSSPLPKRNNTAQKILNGGQSMTWLVGNKLITVTTSGCTLKAVKQGFCDRCYTECRVKPVPIPAKTKEESDQDGSSDKTRSSLTEKDKSDLGPGSRPKVVYRQERQVCACWCKAWAEILVKRAAGSVSWTMRLSNELHPLQCPKDFNNSEVSTFLLSPLATTYDDQVPLRKGSFTSEMVSSRFERTSAKMGPLAIAKASSEMMGTRSERVASEPVSIPCSPIRKNASADFDDFEEGPGRSRNPVRRSNSSPEMSSNWKNPLLGSELDFDFSETKKKQSSKDMRGNWEAIPEEIGTTPPTSEALMLAPVDHPDQKPSRSSRDGDPSGLPPLGFKRDRGHTISVMSPARKPESRGGWGAEPPPRPLATRSGVTTPIRSGVNPAFAFLQLYHSPYFGSSTEKPYLVSNVPSVQIPIKHLDWIPPYEVHKVGVLYVGPGQTEEADILRNEYGSPRYFSFLEKLGTLINLAEADPQHIFLGGLETTGSDGKFAYIWQDDVMQVIFHVATMMPNKPNDPLGNSKKKHIGNNYVTIVYNESGENYNFQTVKAQFNFAVVVVEPLDVNTSQVIVKAREDLHQHIPHTDYQVVSDESASILARQLAIHANLASTISRKQGGGEAREPYASNWLERLRQIKRIRSKLQLEQVSEDRSITSHRRLLIDDFTEYS